MSFSTASSSSQHHYVALRPPPTSPPLRPVRTKRRCLGLSSGCLLLLLLGLLLFFLVPRRPIVRYQSSTLTLDEDTAVVQLQQLFSYYNPNYYTVRWNNLHVQVEDQGSHTPLGYGWQNVSFPVGALQSRSVAVNITITAAFSQLAPLIKEQCAALNFVTLASYGTVDAWIWSQNFGSIRIGPFEEKITCGGAATMHRRGGRR